MAKAERITDRCTQYALDVTEGRIIAGELVRLACQRHLDDIEKSKAAPYRYYFDVEQSEKIINFAEELTIAEDERKVIQTVQNVLHSVGETERKVIHQWDFGCILRQFRRLQVRENILHSHKARPGEHRL